MTKKQVEKVKEDISSEVTELENIKIEDHLLESDTPDEPEAVPYMSSASKKEAILMELDRLRGAIKMGTFDASALEGLWIIVSKLTNEGKKLIAHVAK